MIKKRTIARAVAISAAAALAAGGVLTGCSAQSGGEAAPKTFTYWSMWKEGEPQQKVIAQAIEDFSEETGIDVDVQWTGREVLKQIEPRLAAGNPPDLFDQSGSGIWGTFASKDAVLGLDDVYETTPIGESEKIGDLIPESLAHLFETKDGQALLVPYSVTGVTTWYNGLTDELDGQLTWDEFTAYADELKAEGRPAFTVDGDQSYYEMYWFAHQVARHGGAEVLDAVATDKTGEAAEDPAILAAAEDLFPLLQGGYLPDDFAGTTWPAQQTGWADGSNGAAFLTMGAWAPSETGAALEKSGIDVDSTIQYRSMPYPSVEGGKGNDITWVDDFGFAIPAKARHADAAKEFIRYFVGKDTLQSFATDSASLASRGDLDVPVQLTDFAAQVAASAEAGALVPALDGSAANSNWSGQVLYPSVADLFNKKFESPEAFVAALKQRTIDTLAAQG
jgi:ABC-type glycerol-3-phosphate transport system substrate-binding protein